MGSRDSAHPLRSTLAYLEHVAARRAPDTDPALTEMTSEIVGAYVAHNSVPPVDVPALIRSVHATLASLGASEPAVPEPAKLVPMVPIKKTATDQHIISLEDGKPYDTLKRHLTKLSLTPAAYRTKWCLPPEYPMVSASSSAARSALAKELGLGSMRRKR